MCPLLTAEVVGARVDQTVLSARADKVVVSSRASAFAAQQLLKRDSAAGCAQVAKLAKWVPFLSDTHAAPAEGCEKSENSSIIAKWKERPALLGFNG